MIGAGFIGQLAHLMNYCELENCEVVALAELRPELRKKVLSRYGIPRGYATHRELLKDSEVEAVVVVTPRNQTSLVVLDCLEAGKHVLSEKPMAGTSEQARKLITAAEKKQMVYSVGYMKRYDEGVQAAKSILDNFVASGELGNIHFARAHCYMGDSYCKADGHVVTEEKAVYENTSVPLAPAWLPGNLHTLFAVYVNTYSHNTNLLRYLFDKTPQVDFVNLSTQRGQLAVLNFGEFSASLETGRTSNRGWDEVTEVFFENGTVTLRTPPALLKNVPASVTVYRAGQTQEITIPQVNWTWSFRRQAQAFIRDALEGTAGLSPAQDAIRDLELIELMWKKEISK